MLKVRIYHANEKECDELINILKDSYNLLLESSDYKDRNSKYKRRYLEIEKITKPKLTFKIGR